MVNIIYEKIGTAKMFNFGFGEVYHTYEAQDI